MAMMAAVALICTACGIPTGGTPTVIAKADLPAHLLNPLPTPTTNPSGPPTVGVPELIYLVAPSQHLVAVSRDVQIPASLSQIVGALLEGPTRAESTNGLQSFLVSDIGLTATVSGGIATVDFEASPIQVVGPDQTLGISQVVFTVTQQPGITGVAFQIAGNTIEVPTAAGAQVAGPVNRSDYAAQAPVP
jgi:hypothetical protein